MLDITLDSILRVWAGRVYEIVCFSSDVAPLSRTGILPVLQRMSFLASQAGKPVPKQVIENGARCEF